MEFGLWHVILQEMSPRDKTNIKSCQMNMLEQSLTYRLAHYFTGFRLKFSECKTISDIHYFPTKFGVFDTDISRMSRVLGKSKQKYWMVR